MVNGRGQLDVSLAIGLIRAQFPQLEPIRATYLGAGYDSDAFEINGQWVFRFPKRADVAQQLLVEWRALPALSSVLPLKIPDFSFHGRPSDTFPFHFGGYLKLPGVPAIDITAAEIPFQRLAPALGGFLSALHSFPVGHAVDRGVPVQDSMCVIEETRSETLADFESVARVAPSAPLATWRSFLERELNEMAPPTSPPVVTHNDLAAEHILLDPDSLTMTGVIDWSDIAIGDPAIDLAGVFHWGGQALVDAVVASYAGDVDPAMLRRARLLAARRGAGDVVFGLERGRAEYVDAGLRALALAIGL